MYSNQKPEGNLYPEVIITNPETPTSSSSLYPTIDTMEGISNNLFPYHDDTVCGSPNGQIPVEQLLVTIPGAIVHLIDNQRSVELACGELNVVCLKQGSNTVAVLARVGDEIQWPLAKDEGVVKLDSAHYFFTLRIPGEEESRRDSESLLNYGLTVASRGQERVLKELDSVLEKYSAFSVQKVRWKGNWEVLNGKLAKETSPQELEKDEKKKEAMGENSTAYWTTLAPNVEDYSGCVARMIASGSGQLIRGIIWCGDVTVDRLKWGEEFLSKRMGPSSNSEISPQAVKRMKSVKRVTKMSEKVASGVLTGVVKVSGFFTSSIVNSKVGKKFFSLLPGEIVLASLDGFNKVFDAVEVAGKNVMSTSSTVTTGLVSQRYGEQAAEVTDEGLGAAGHAIGTAWAVFKMRKALNPKSVFKPTTLAKAAAKANSDELKAKYSK